MMIDMKVLEAVQIACSVIAISLALVVFVKEARRGTDGTGDAEGKDKEG